MSDLERQEKILELVRQRLSINDDLTTQGLYTWMILAEAGAKMFHDNVCVADQTKRRA